MKRDTRILAAMLAAVASAILAASSLCAFAVAQGASPRWRLVFRLLCHGLENRCLTMFAVPMPICARCAAIYFGLVAGAAAFFVLPLFEERIMRVAMYVAAMPLAVDGITQAIGLRESTNGLRVVTGFIAASAFGIWTLTAVQQHKPEAITPS